MISESLMSESLASQSVYIYNQMEQLWCDLKKTTKKKLFYFFFVNYKKIFSKSYKSSFPNWWEKALVPRITTPPPTSIARYMGVCVHMDSVDLQGSQRSRRVTLGTAGACDSVSQQGSDDAGLHIPSVSGTISSHSSDICNSKGMKEKWLLTVSWWPLKNHAVTLLGLFSFLLRSEVLFGLPFGMLVKHNWCLIRTGSLAHTPAPFFYFVLNSL